MASSNLTGRLREEQAEEPATAFSPAGGTLAKQENSRAPSVSLQKGSLRTRLLLATGMILLLAIGLFWQLFPHFFFHVMKDHLYLQVGDMVEANALRQSYIWQNNRLLKELAENPSLHQLLMEWEETRGQDPYDEICSYLPGRNTAFEAEQEVSLGHIYISDFFFLLSEDGTVFCKAAEKPLASTLSQTPQVQEVNMQEIFMGHLEAITEETSGLSYLPVIETFQAGGHGYALLRMVELSGILQQFQDLEEKGITDFLLLCRGTVLYQNLGAESRIPLTQIPSHMFSPIQYDLQLQEEEEGILLSALCTYEAEDLRIFVWATREAMLSPYRPVFGSFCVLLALLAIIILAVFWIPLSSALVRLSRLEKKMEQVREGSYDAAGDLPVKELGSDEIGRLSHTFQIMLEKIRQDMKDNERMQYTLLVSAIDPHYIYNTLNTVTALAELGRTQEVAAVNNALIGTLKDRLRMKNYKIFDTVQVEKEALEQYMLLQSYLSYVLIDYHFEAKEEVLGQMIPKNILQPLVENSIKHGIWGKKVGSDGKKRGRIQVEASLEEEKIRLRVEDDGIGMDEKTLQLYFERRPKGGEKKWQEAGVEHIGIRNVLMRLTYLYGDTYQARAFSLPEGGLCIELLLPRTQ